MRVSSVRDIIIMCYLKSLVCVCVGGGGGVRFSTLLFPGVNRKTRHILMIVTQPTIKTNNSVSRQEEMRVMGTCLSEARTWR